MRKCEEIDNPDANVAVRLDLDQDSEEDLRSSNHGAHSTTLNSLLDNNVNILVLTHLSGDDSISGVADYLEEFTGHSVQLVEEGDLSASLMDVNNDEILLYENLYDMEGEIIDSDEDISSVQFDSFVDEVSSNIDAYVNDSFSLSHMELPSTTELSKEVPSYAGRFLDSEVDFLSSVRSSSEDIKFFFSGTNISRDLDSIENILARTNDYQVVTSGLISLVFLEADGYDLGVETRELIEDEGSEQSIDVAYEILTQYGERVHIPKDVASYSGGSKSEYALSATPISEPIEDIGSETAEMYEGLFNDSDLVVSTGVTSKNQVEMDTYERTLQADYSVVAGSETISFCDEVGMTGFTHTTRNPNPLIQFLIGDELPALQSLLP